MLKTVNNERIYHDHYNNLAYANLNGVKTGCEVTASSPNALTVEISAGQIFFTTSVSAVPAETLTGFVVPDGLNKRIDLVVIEADTTISIISGDTYKHPTDPRPPVYDPDTYIVLARIEFDADDSVITSSNIKDMRILNQGGAGGTGAGVGRFNQTFEGVTTVTVTHNLGDLRPIVQVYDENAEQVTPDVIDITDGNNLRIEFLTVSTGGIIVHGGEGADLGASAYYSQSFTNQTSVVVTHGLGQKYVGVHAYNVADEKLDISEIDLTDLNNLTSTFSGMTSGTIIVVGGSTKVQGSEDLLPDTDNVYDIGSDTYRWKDGSFAGNVGMTTLNDQTPAGFKKSDGVFTSSTTSVTVVDVFCTADSLVTIAINATTTPVGVWSVESESGQFVVTSDSTETSSIDFEYYIQRGI